MISSLVITLDRNRPELTKTLGKISARDGIESGKLVDGFRLPVTVETSGKRTMQETTRWIQQLPAVLNVDVVFVHFENEVRGTESSVVSE